MRRFALGSLIAVAIALAGDTASAQAPQQWVIATGGTGGVYYPLGGGFANILGKTIPGVVATAQVTGGSVDNLRLIGSGKAQIALTQVDAAWDAVQGTDKFTSGKINVQ